MTSPAPLILAFDTSAAHVACALTRGHGVLDARHVDMAKGQGENLMPMLDDLLKSQDLTWADLDLIGVGIGPGNFTGIRISVAAARGLALGLGIPAIGISGLAALAYGAPRPTLALVDGKRGAAYGQVFDGDTPDAPSNDALTTWHDIASTHGFNIRADALIARAGEAPTLPIATAIALNVADLSDRLGADIAKTPRPAPLYLRAADAAPARDLPPVMLDTQDSNHV